MTCHTTHGTQNIFLIRETTKNNSKSWIPLSDKAFEIAERLRENRFGEDFLFINPVTRRGYRMEYLRRVWRLKSGLDVDHYSATYVLKTYGEGGIRTPGGVTPTTVFETAAFNRSATSPGFSASSPKIRLDNFSIFKR